jgi:hypothetical protein
MRQARLAALDPQNTSTDFKDAIQGKQLVTTQKLTEAQQALQSASAILKQVR